jgi:ADP-ribosylglycohydrolase
MDRLDRKLHMTFPPDYIERTYAGVLGKIIGVYLGRPVETWLYERIIEEMGEIEGYVHEKRSAPLVVTDDDIAGTFTFLRALEDNNYTSHILPRQIGQTWLNYIIENRTIIWWGGLFHSTEHTAFLHLKEGIPAPQSGSIERNGPIIANQIGAQIYIDGWAMVSPGDPERAADLAQRAASVSHDDEALNAARLIAAMEAQAYVEEDINRLIDTGLSLIPASSLVYRLVQDVREWREKDNDWRKTRQRIVAEYGYKKYVGGCHVIPNHALIQLGLLYGGGDFNKSLKICVTSGWDTDCNAGNLGCLLGIRSGVAAFEGPIDWRGPVADRMFLPTADGGNCITDAVRETDSIVRAAYRVKQLPAPSPKGGQRFHFEQSGSVQGFQVKSAPGLAKLTLKNIEGLSQTGRRCLRMDYQDLLPEQCARAATATFILPADLNMGGYELIASPTLYPGQTVEAQLIGDPENIAPVEASLFLHYYNGDDRSTLVRGPAQKLSPAETCLLAWKVPDTHAGPIYQIGIEIRGINSSSTAGSVYLDYLGWSGAPDVTFSRPPDRTLPGFPLLYRRAWVNAVDHWEYWWNQPFRIIQNSGRGLISTGTHDWHDYAASARVTAAKFHAGGIAVRVQGLRRYYALLLTDGNKVQLIKALVDDQVLAEQDFSWDIWTPYEMRLESKGNRLRAWIDKQLLFDIEDSQDPLSGGGVALVVDRGHLAAPEISVKPV